LFNSKLNGRKLGFNTPLIRAAFYRYSTSHSQDKTLCFHSAIIAYWASNLKKSKTEN